MTVAATRTGTKRPAQGPDPELAGPRPCAVCAREARGFGYVHQMRRDLYPVYRFCSRRCQDAGAALASRNKGMIDATPIEKQAIKETRRALAEALGELRLLDSFADLGPEQVDGLILAIVNGFRTAMQLRCLNDDCPF
jgi:hypothetical protein